MPYFDLPKLSKAPRALHAVEGPCGPLAAWGILQHLHKWTSVARLIQLCGHTKKEGVFAIALAVALREHGVQVEFYAQPDPLPNPIETQYYQRAADLGLYRREPPELETLLSLVSPDCIPIILYNTDGDIGHFSPIVGIDGDQVYLPYSDERQMPKDELQERWSAPGILRQCILVRRPIPTGGHSLVGQ